MNPQTIVISILCGFAGIICITILLAFARGFSLYTVVNECEAQVFTLFGKVIGTIDQAGLHFPVRTSGPRAVQVAFFGKQGGSHACAVHAQHHNRQRT